MSSFAFSDCVYAFIFRNLINVLMDEINQNANYNDMPASAKTKIIIPKTNLLIPNADIYVYIYMFIYIPRVVPIIQL